MTEVADVVENNDLEKLSSVSDDMSVAKIQRIKDSGAAFSSNDNISDWIQPHEHALLKQELEAKMESLFDSMLIDYKNDHNTKIQLGEWLICIMMSFLKGDTSQCLRLLSSLMLRT